jgi:diacylglycerol kinase (ATP)
MPPRRVALVVNRTKQGGELDRAAGWLRDAGIEVQLVAPREKREIGAAVRGVGEADVVVVGGGDGTLNAAAPALVELGRPIAVLPLGTANDLARSLGVPRDPVAASEVIVGGEYKSIDLGRANGRYFFNAASVGLSVTVARRLTGARKRRWGVFGYPVAVLDALRAMRSFRAVIECDGERLETRAVQVAVGNGRHYGGGMTIDGSATIDDGLLHVFAVEAIGVARLIAAAPLLRWGRHEWLKSSHVLAGRRIRIETDPRRSLNTDGEIWGRTPVELEVVPDALTVIVPRGPRSGRESHVSD